MLIRYYMGKKILGSIQDYPTNRSPLRIHKASDYGKPLHVISRRLLVCFCSKTFKYEYLMDSVLYQCTKRLMNLQCVDAHHL